MRCFAYFLASAILCASFASSALAQTTKNQQPEEVVGVRELPSYIVCPPYKYPTSVFVPADLLLQEADAVQPMTSEGWIVTNRPLVVCGSLPLSAAARAYDDFEYPMQLRRYETQILLAQAELAKWDFRLPVYQYFNKTGALMVDYQNAIIARMAVSERLQNLEYERLYFIRHHIREKRLAEQGIIVRQEIVDAP